MADNSEGFATFGLEPEVRYDNKQNEHTEDIDSVSDTEAPFGENEIEDEKEGIDGYSDVLSEETIPSLSFSDESEKENKRGDTSDEDSSIKKESPSDDVILSNNKLEKGEANLSDQNQYDNTVPEKKKEQLISKDEMGKIREKSFFDRVESASMIEILSMLELSSSIISEKIPDFIKKTEKNSEEIDKFSKKIISSASSVDEKLSKVGQTLSVLDNAIEKRADMVSKIDSIPIKREDYSDLLTIMRGMLHELEDAKLLRSNEISQNKRITHPASSGVAEAVFNIETKITKLIREKEKTREEVNAIDDQGNLLPSPGIKKKKENSKEVEDEDDYLVLFKIKKTDKIISALPFLRFFLIFLTGLGIGFFFRNILAFL